MLKKQKIKLNNKDINIKFSLENSNHMIGYQQEIEKLTSFNALDITNPVEDEEVRRFKYISNDVVDLIFSFHIPQDNNFEPSLTEANFSFDEIKTTNSAIQNSFFIVDFYDTFNKFSQTKLFSNYNTKIIVNVGDSDKDKTIYRLNSTNQFYYINVPVWLIDLIKSGETDFNYYYGDNNIAIVYARFLFYNAKTGIIYSFYNRYNNHFPNDERYYAKIELNLDSFTWKFLTPTVQTQNRLLLREIERNRNEKFNEKVNNSINNVNQERIQPPDGNVFKDETGNYDNT